MNLFQIIQMLQGGQLNQLQQNPLFNQAQQMLQGKNPQQINDLIGNLARERGIDGNQLNQMVSQFQQMGIK